METKTTIIDAMTAYFDAKQKQTIMSNTKHTEGKMSKYGAELIVAHKPIALACSTEADAIRICTAWNGWDQSQAALRDALASMDRWIGSNFWDERDQETYDNIRKAII